MFNKILLLIIIIIIIIGLPSILVFLLKCKSKDMSPKTDFHCRTTRVACSSW